MPKMYLICGCSGSGKTTFSKQFAKDNNLLYLGVDDLYQKVNGDECLHINSFDVWIEFFKAIHRAEIKGVDCIVDTNALTRVHRAQFIEWFPTFEHHLIYIHASPALRKKNNKSRRRQVPDKVMDEMTLRVEVSIPNEGFKSYKIIHNFDNHFVTVFYEEKEN